MIFFKNERVTTFLERFFDSDKRLVQNLLFWGEKSVGKMTTAEAFSKALLCHHTNNWEICGHCASCKMIKKGCHPDFKIIEADKESIKIEQIREGLNFLIYHPQISSLRILIINNADKMTEDSQNALLKTLEEPRDNNIIILVTEAPKRLLETVRSRLLSLRFKRVPYKEITDFLIKEYHLPSKEAEEISQRADGRIGEVINLLNKDYRKESDKRIKELEKIINQDFSVQSSYFQKLTENDEDLINTLEEWLKILKIDKKSEKIKLNSRQRIRLIDNLLKALYLIKETNVNRLLLMENIFLQL